VAKVTLLMAWLHCFKDKKQKQAKIQVCSSDGNVLNTPRVPQISLGGSLSLPLVLSGKALSDKGEKRLCNWQTRRVPEKVDGFSTVRRTASGRVRLVFSKKMRQCHHSTTSALTK